MHKLIIYALTLMPCYLGNPSLAAFNTRPVAHDDQFVTGVETPVLLDVIANDIDPDGQLLTVRIGIPTNLNDPNQKVLNCDDGQGGTFDCGTVINNRDGSLTFIPAPGFTDTVSFSYTVDDGIDSDGGSVTVTIDPTKTVGLVAILSHPEDASAITDGVTTFSISASGPQLEFSWFLAGQAIAGGLDYTITPTTTACDLIIQNMDPSKIGMVYCVVTGTDPDTGETYSVTSNAARLRLDTSVGSGAFAGQAPSLPHLFEAETYDLGAEGISHHDLTAGNQQGYFRTGDADIDQDNENRVFVTDIQQGEWLNYSFQNDLAGLYDLRFTLAADSSNAPNGAMLAMTLNGQTYMCQRNLGNTLGSDDWQTRTVSGIWVPAGSQVFQVEFQSDGWQLDSFELIPSAGVQAANTATGQPHALGQIQAEDYDLGGKGIAYEDQSEGNSGNLCLRQPDWVDITKTGAITHVNHLAAGEWLEYTVNLPAGGTMFDLGFRYTTTGTGPGFLNVEVPTEGTSFAVTLPATPAGTWQIHEVYDLPLGSGVKTLRLSMTQPNFALDHFNIDTSIPPVAIRMEDASGTTIGNGQQNVPFGTTQATHALAKTFTIYNDHSTLDLQISQFQVSGSGWSTVTAPPAIIPPGGSGDFTVQLLASTAIGDSVGSISFDSSGANRDGFAFTTLGTVTSNLTSMVVEYTTDPNFLTWLPVQQSASFTLLNDDMQRDFRFTNPDDGTGATLNIVISRDNPNYLLFDGQTMRDIDSVSFSIPPGQTQSFVVRLEEPATEEYHELVHINITGNATNSPLTFKMQKWGFPGGPITKELPWPVLQGVVGGSAQATLLVSGGTGNYIYRWDKDTGSLGICCDYEPIDPSLPNHEGENTATLTISNLTLIQDQTVYKVTAYDAATYNPIDPDSGNKVFDDNIPLRVFEALYMTAQPQSHHATLGSTVQYSVVADGGSGGFSFQWQYRPQGGAWTDLAIDGVHYQTSAWGDILTVNGVTDADVGEYRCRIHQPGLEENLVYSDPAYLSTLRFVQHPADVFDNFSGTFAVQANGGGLPLTYEWQGLSNQTDLYGNPLHHYDQTGEMFTGTATDTLLVKDWRMVNFRNFACLVSDGYVSVLSSAGKIHLITTGLAAGDFFWHGNGQAEALNGVALPFGGGTWQADTGLFHLLGMAYLPQSGPAQTTASIPWQPITDAVNRVEIVPQFPSGSGSGTWIEFGLFDAAGPELWVRLAGNGDFQMYAGNNVLIGSGSAGSALNDRNFILAVDDQARTVTLYRGAGTLIADVPWPVNYMPDFLRAGFRLNRATGAGDLGITEFLTRTLGQVTPKDDVIFLDRSEVSSILISPLANDMGDSLFIDEVVGLNPEHGSANLIAGVNVEYTPDAGWTGWDTFAYGAWHNTTMDGGFAEIRVFTHDGPTLHAEDDTVVMTENTAQVIEVLANDFFTENSNVQFHPTAPIFNQPFNGQVIVNADGTITYTPDANFRGWDRFRYQIQSDTGLTAIAWVRIHVEALFQGGRSDDYRQVGLGRGYNHDLKKTVTPEGGGVWQEEPGSGLFLFIDGELRTSGTANNVLSSRPFLGLPDGIDGLTAPHLTENFESGTTAAWVSVVRSELQDYEATPALAGNKSLRISLPGGSSSNLASYVNSTFPVHAPKLNLRFLLDVNQNESSWSQVQMFQAYSHGTKVFTLQYRANPTGQFRLVVHRNNGESVLSAWADVPQGLDVYDMALSWWAGDVYRPTGGASLAIDGQIIASVEDVTNKGQALQSFWLGVGQTPGTISGDLIFDNVVVETPGDVAISQQIKFHWDSDSQEDIFFGWFADADKAFADPCQTALFVKLKPGSFNIMQTNADPGMRGRLIHGGSWSYTQGVSVETLLIYHPSDNTISMTVDGQVLGSRIPLNGPLDVGSLDKAGFYWRGTKTLGHRLDSFAVTVPGWTPSATNDHLTLYENEYLTFDVRDNDINPNADVPRIVNMPVNGRLEVHNDGTMSYKPLQAGTDQLTYALGPDAKESFATVTFDVEPVLGISSPEPIPLVKVFEEDFESRRLDDWTLTGDSTQFHYRTDLPISGQSSAQFKVAANPTPTYIEHTEPSLRNYYRVRFNLRQDDLVLGAGQNSVKILQIYGNNAPLVYLSLQPGSTGSVYLTGIRKGPGSWTGSGWKNLDPSLEYQTIDVEFWGSHPNYPNGGCRLWVNGVMTFENNNFPFRHNDAKRFELGWLTAPVAGSTGSLTIDDLQVYRSAYVLQFKDTFENGMVWDELIDNFNRSSLTTVAPINETTSFAVDIPGADNRQAFIRNYGTSTKHMRVQFKLAAQSLNMTNDADNFIFYQARDPQLARIRGFYRQRPTPGIMIQGFKPNGNWTGGGWRNLDPIALETGITIESEWWTQSLFGNQGGIRLWYDQSLQYENQNVDQGEVAVDRYMFGVISGIEADTSGTFLLDDFQWWSFEVRE